MREMPRHGGTVITSTGDGVVATFSVPSHAVRCAHALVEVGLRIGLESRVGVHACEVELRGTDVNGLAMAIGARRCALAGPGEVLRTVRDIPLGSGLSFDNRRIHARKRCARPLGAVCRRTSVTAA